MNKTDKNENTEVQYASFFYRMLASFIDTILSSILLIPIFNMFNKFFDISAADMSLQPLTQEQAIEQLMQTLPSSLFQIIVIAAIVIVFWIYRAATPGKMLLKMKIVDARTGKQPTNTRLIVRYLGYFISVLPLCLGFVWIYYDKRKQGFHDKLAGTVVMQKKGFSLLSFIISTPHK